MKPKLMTYHRLVQIDIQNCKNTGHERRCWLFRLTWPGLGLLLCHWLLSRLLLWFILLLLVLCAVFIIFYLLFKLILFWWQLLLISLNVTHSAFSGSFSGVSTFLAAAFCKKTNKHLYKMRGWMEGEIKGRYLNCVSDYGPSYDQWRAQHSAR